MMAELLTYKTIERLRQLNIERISAERDEANVWAQIYKGQRDEARAWARKFYQRQLRTLHELEAYVDAELDKFRAMENALIAEILLKKKFSSTLRELADAVADDNYEQIAKSLARARQVLE